MNKTDFSRLKKMGEINLTEHVIGGEHYPKVKTYLTRLLAKVFRFHSSTRNTEQPVP